MRPASSPRFGVSPETIPDYLALVGDSRRWLSGPSRLGSKIHLCRAGQIRPHRIHPVSARDWHVNVLNSASWPIFWRVSETRRCFVELSPPLGAIIPLFENVDRLRWTGARENLDAIGRLLDKAVT